VKGEVTDDQIPVVSTGSISGRVTHSGTATTGAKAVSGPLADAVIELSGPVRVMYRSTDAAGRYLFTGLPAGAYTVKLRVDRMSGYWTCDPEYRTLDMSAGQSQTGIDFTVIPQEREIEITTEMQPDGKGV
jgi:Carboxypeptidase regulatory-like domain